MINKLKISLLLLSISLYGCDALLQSSEDRINAAIPMYRDIVQSIDNVLESVTAEKRKEIENEISKRLKIRALTCSGGYTPSWSDSEEDIRKRLRDRSCFNNSDIEFAKWIRFIQVSFILAEPSLRPIPSTIQKYYVVDESISWVYEADNAGILFITLNKGGFQIVDLESGDTIFKEINESKVRGGSISANGRLFTSGNREQVDIRRTDTGAVVVSMPGAGVYDYHWFGNRGAVYKLVDDRRTMLIDFVTGKETPLAGILSTIRRVTPLNDEGQFLITTSEGVSKVEVEWSSQEPSVKLIAESNSSNSLTEGNSGITADRERYFGGFDDTLSITSTASFEQDKVSLKPFQILRAIATPDPDKIILNGIIRDVSGVDRLNYYYSINDQTLALIDKSELISDQFLYIPTVNSLVAIRHNKLVMLDDPSSDEPVEISKFVSSKSMEANLKKLEEFDRQQASMPLYESKMGLLGTTENHSKPILDIPNDANIEAVGVYQGRNGGSRPGEPHKTANVDVRIRRSDKPVVLVLSSHESVLWRVILEPGARLDAVIISGHHTSKVIGVGSTRTIVLGGTYAYKSSTPEYRDLDSEVYRLTGKHISMFQGNHEGSSFVIGGTRS